MKPWFLLLVMGALSGFVVLRTALAEPDTTAKPRHNVVASADWAE